MCVCTCIYTSKHTHLCLVCMCVCKCIHTSKHICILCVCVIASASIRLNTHVSELKVINISTSTKHVGVLHTCIGLAKAIYIHRIFGDFPAKNTVYTPYIYGSGQPYTCTLAHNTLDPHHWRGPFLSGQGTGSHHHVGLFWEDRITTILTCYAHAPISVTPCPWINYPGRQYAHQPLPLYG